MTYRPPKKPTLALETDIVQDNIPAEVFPKIFIGSIHAAFNQEALISHGITHILNASRLPSTFPKSFTYLSIDIRDKDESNILACIPAANIFIEAGIESGGVMIHCYGGRSRSAAFVAAFLMSSFGWSYHTAVQRIQTVRSVAHINKGFEIQLRAYAHANYDVYIAQQVLLQGRVRAVQSYRSIEGDSADALLVKATERKKFGSLHPVGSNGNTSRRRHNSQNSSGHPPGSKRSWGNAKDDDTLSSSSEDAEEEDNLMECAVKPSQSHSPPRDHHTVGTGTSSSHHSISGGMSGAVHYLSPQHAGAITSSDSHTHSNSFRLRQQVPLMDPRSPRLRLSRPGSTSVRVIPPLRGLERAFCCAWCHSHLFNLASVIRTDVHVQPLPELHEANLYAHQKNEADTLDSYTSHSLFPLDSPRGAKQTTTSHQEHEATYLMPAPSPRGSSHLSFAHTSYPSDAKISTPSSANKSFGSGSGSGGSSGNGSGFKSPPKTMRAKSSKAFNFDLLDEPQQPPHTQTLTQQPHSHHTATPQMTYSSPRPRPCLHVTSIDEQVHQYKSSERDGSGGGDGERVTSPMEISDEKLIPILSHENKLDEKPPLSSRHHEQPQHLHLQQSQPSSRRSSSSAFSMPVNPGGDDGNVNVASVSRPTSSSYRSKAPAVGISGHSSDGAAAATGGGATTPGTDSPRITFPPGCRDSFVYPSPRNRPQSAEKRRWLARVNLLKSGLNDNDQGIDDNDNDFSSFTTDLAATSESFSHAAAAPLPSSSSSNRRHPHDAKVAKLSRDDDEAIKLGFGQEKYIHLEYLEWMGEELLSSSIEAGELKCGNCRSIIGSWTWCPSTRHTLNGILQAPVIRVHKNVVHEVDIPLDPTPANTPRVDDLMEDGHANI